MSDDTQDITAEEREYTLDELSKLADVTPRTVRYYIAEDLLPPPIVGGRNATYSQEHLDRLVAIGGLKAMYLPLREIRHRLNTLTPEQMRNPEYLATLARNVATERAKHRHAMGRGGRRRAYQEVAESAGRREYDPYSGKLHVIYTIPTAKRLLNLIRKYGTESDFEACDKYLVGNKKLAAYWAGIRGDEE